MCLRRFVKYTLSTKLHTDQAQYYDHLSNTVFIHLLLPQHHDLFGTWAPADCWRCAVASGTKMLSTDSLSCIWSLQPTNLVSTDAWLDRDLKKFDNTFFRQYRLLCSSIIPKLFLVCGSLHTSFSRRTSLPSSHSAAFAFITSMCAVIPCTLSTRYNSSCSWSSSYTGVPTVGTFVGQHGRPWTHWGDAEPFTTNCNAQYKLYS